MGTAASVPSAQLANTSVPAASNSDDPPAFTQAELNMYDINLNGVVDSRDIAAANDKLQKQIEEVKETYGTKSSRQTMAIIGVSIGGLASVISLMTIIAGAMTSDPNSSASRIVWGVVLLLLFGSLLIASAIALYHENVTAPSEVAEKIQSLNDSSKGKNILSFLQARQ